MDIYNDDYLLGKPAKFGLEQENIDKEKMVGQAQRETFSKAVKAGVKMAFGTDAGVYPHGDNAKAVRHHGEVRHDAGAGHSHRNAELRRPDRPQQRRWHDRSRQVRRHHRRSGRSAQPTSAVLQSVGFVMKGGVVYKDKLAGTPVQEY